ncbi:hypothetical protein BDP27DRAFT_931721 [Rhodocollybia butyracea]|uniref:Uncharacterized protein n=1 Tax=Rhodocollybia butyracea TaxID=206335 RepID=A0A9P5U5Z3_9AGAR|nr:hypothetical protein BDP27DRAFT_931721 [Rhodocollybia butyracea]
MRVVVVVYGFLRSLRSTCDEVGLRTTIGHVTISCNHYAGEYRIYTVHFMPSTAITGFLLFSPPQGPGILVHMSVFFPLVLSSGRRQESRKYVPEMLIGLTSIAQLKSSLDRA